MQDLLSTDMQAQATNPCVVKMAKLVITPYINTEDIKYIALR